MHINANKGMNFDCQMFIRITKQHLMFNAKELATVNELRMQRETEIRKKTYCATLLKFDVFCQNFLQSLVQLNFTPTVW